MHRMYFIQLKLTLKCLSTLHFLPCLNVFFYIDPLNSFKTCSKRTSWVHRNRPGSQPLHNIIKRDPIFKMSYLPDNAVLALEATYQSLIKLVYRPN